MAAMRYRKLNYLIGIASTATFPVAPTHKAIEEFTLILSTVSGARQ